MVIKIDERETGWVVTYSYNGMRTTHTSEYLFANREDLLKWVAETVSKKERIVPLQC